MTSQRPDMDDLPHTEWKCEECGVLNSCLDGDCQFCDGPPDIDPRAEESLPEYDEVAQ